MVLKNLLRRKGRTFLTVIGVSIGVASIIILGSLANGIENGYDSLITGAKADLVLSQPDTLDISLAGIDEDYGDMMLAMSEVHAVDGMVQGIVASGDMPYLFVFGYPEDGFSLNRFKIKEGYPLNSRQAQEVQGKPALLGSASAEALNKEVGDSIKITSTLYRIVGIYETGSAFEDGGVVLSLKDAQVLLGRQRQVSVFYIQLKEPALRERVLNRAERLWPNLQLTTASEFADQQILGDMMGGYVSVIAGMAILIGGVVMTNSQLMAVFERTREIGTLRALGWPSRKIMVMILAESTLTSLLGGVVGVAMGIGTLKALAPVMVAYGASPSSVGFDLILLAFFVVIVLGISGGIYPAQRAAKLEPIEALSYEGGTGSNKQKPFPIGGMATQSLWKRTSRTILTLAVIGLTIGSIITLQALVEGASIMMNGMSGGGAEIMIRQANVADTSQSVIDQSILQKINALPQVQSASGMVFTAVAMEEAGGFFVIQGYEVGSYGIKRFNIVEGEPLRGNRQIIIGRTAAEALSKDPGDTIEILGSRFKIVGIYETGTGWEEIGGVVTNRDAQVLTGKPRKVTIAQVKLVDPRTSEEVLALINSNFPDLHATLSGDFADQLPDMQAMDAMMGAVAFIAILIGGVGIMNTMLMSILERTREIGTLRALGWQRRAILSLIMRESLLLGLLGGLIGLIIAFSIITLFSSLPLTGEVLTMKISIPNILNALFTALLLGTIGGIYPALRATRLQPIEALRYE